MRKVSIINVHFKYNKSHLLTVKTETAIIIVVTVPNIVIKIQFLIKLEIYQLLRIMIIIEQSF
jgi:hypothetical protein